MKTFSITTTKYVPSAQSVSIKIKKAITCSKCKHEIHIKCNDISQSSYQSLKEDKTVDCLSCTIFNNSLMLPITLVADEILLGTNVTDLHSIVDSLPTLEILSKLQNLPRLAPSLFRHL